MTDEQLAKAERLRAGAQLGQVSFRKAYIQATGLEAQCANAVISNGVINLAPDKAAVCAGNKPVLAVATRKARRASTA